MRRLPLTLGCSLIWAVWLSSMIATQGRAEIPADLQLEQQLLKGSSELLRQLDEKGIRHVGVLKFAVRYQGSRFPNSLDRLNMRLAEKTELALLWANSPSDYQDRIWIIRGATEIAAQIPGATHLNKDQDARDRLFSRDYPLARKKPDGTQQVRPDALISGVAELNEDLSVIEIQLLALLPGEPQLIELEKFQAPVGTDDLQEYGVSVIAQAGENRRERTLESAILNRLDPKSNHPFSLPQTPVRLSVIYDGQLQPIRFLTPDQDRSALEPGAYVSEPLPKQTVTLKIHRGAPQDRTRYGVVLRVNGLNTIQKETLPDLRTRMWVLEPETDSIEIGGFSVTLGEKGEREPFKVLNEEDSLKLESFYSRNTGLISLTVFAEELKAARIERDTAEYENRALYSIKRTVLNKPLDQDISIARSSLINELFQQTEELGIIHWDGNRDRFATRTTTFHRRPEPLFSAVIRYYRPRNP